MERIKKMNGMIINGEVYNRVYDFDRDAISDLVRKMFSWSINYRKKHIPKIKTALNHRIEIGGIRTEKYINELILTRINNKLKKDKMERIESIEQVLNSNLCNISTNKVDLLEKIKTFHKKHEILFNEKLDKVFEQTVNSALLQVSKSYTTETLLIDAIVKFIEDFDKHINDL